MKKIAVFALAVLMLSACSFGAFADTITAEGNTDLELSASKDVAYTLSIPSGTKTVDITSAADQTVGEIGLTAANFTTGSIDVAVTSKNGFALKNGEVAVAYTTKTAYSFTEVTDPLESVTLKITDAAAATVAGNYTDTLTFTATANDVA